MRKEHAPNRFPPQICKSLAADQLVIRLTPRLCLVGEVASGSGVHEASWTICSWHRLDPHRLFGGQQIRIDLGIGNRSSKCESYLHCRRHLELEGKENKKNLSFLSYILMLYCMNGCIRWPAFDFLRNHIYKTFSVYRLGCFMTPSKISCPK